MHRIWVTEDEMVDGEHDSSLGSPWIILEEQDALSFAFVPLSAAVYTKRHLCLLASSWCTHAISMHETGCEQASLIILKNHFRMRQCYLRLHAMSSNWSRSCIVTTSCKAWCWIQTITAVIITNRQCFAITYFVLCINSLLCCSTMTGSIISPSIYC